MEMGTRRHHMLGGLATQAAFWTPERAGQSWGQRGHPPEDIGWGGTQKQWRTAMDGSRRLVSGGLWVLDTDVGLHLSARGLGPGERQRLVRGLATRIMTRGPGAGPGRQDARQEETCGAAALQRLNPAPALGHPQ